MTTPEDNSTPATPSARNWRQPELRRSEAMRQAAERVRQAREGRSLLGNEKEER